MKIYFTAAILQKNELGKNYKEIVDTLNKLGHTVIEDTTTTPLETAINKSDEQRVEYYKKVLSWIANCDLVVVESSFPSTLHIGHEISLALEKGKPIAALYLKGKEPSFFLGFSTEKLMWLEYDHSSLEDVLKYALETAQEKMDVRFNFFVSPEIQQYLDWVAKYKRTPRAVYLRELLERDMKENKDWKKQK